MKVTFLKQKLSIKQKKKRVFTTKIMKYILFFTLYFFANFSYSQIFEKLKNQTIQEFAEKSKPNPDATIQGEVLETGFWMSNKKVIFCFYKTIDDVNSKTAEPSVQGYVFVPLENNKYNRVYIDSYLQEGSDAKIESVFFANADTDLNRELFIICKWPQNLSCHSGNLFQVFGYDNLNSNFASQKKLLALSKINKKFNAEFEGYQEKEKKLAKYNTAQKVKQRLMEMGFK
jgi:hypothetical protein